MSKGRTAPGTWRHVAEDNVIVAEGVGMILAWQARSLNVPIQERDANAAFIVLADHHFDAMEKALRDCLTVLCESAPSALGTIRELNDEELGKMWIAVSKQADTILKAIDKERKS